MDIFKEIQKRAKDGIDLTKGLKKELEEELLKTINSFETATGVRVDGIHLENVRITSDSNSKMGTTERRVKSNITTSVEVSVTID